MPLISKTLEEWYKEFNKEEKVWIALAISVAIILAVTTISWHLIDAKHQVPTSSSEFNPSLFRQMAYNFSKTYENQPVPPNVEIYIAAQQYYWSISRLVLKQGVDYKFHLGSLDVLHGFSIVGEGTVYSIMVMPGMEYTFTINFNKAGIYYVICNEYCGYGHGGMRMIIEVIP